MDDLRIQWMRKHVVHGLRLAEEDGLEWSGVEGPGSFDDLLERDNGQPLRELLHFLNDSVKDATSPLAALFYAERSEEYVAVDGELAASKNLNKANVLMHVTLISESI